MNSHSPALFAGVLLFHVILFYLIHALIVFPEKGLIENAPDEGFQRTMVHLVKPSELSASTISKAIAHLTPPPSFTEAAVASKLPTRAFSRATALFDSKNLISNVQLPKLPDGMLTGTRNSGATRGKDGYGNASEIASQSVNLLGMDISTEGPVMVFLDTSESLKKQHDFVESKIKSLLPSCTVVEINGVVFSTRQTLEHLPSRAHLPEYFVSYYLSLVDGSIIPQITKKVEEKQIAGPMAIYYFSDFEDYADPSDVKTFSDLLKTSGIRFYAYSVEKVPSYEIRHMCDETGGAWKLETQSFR